MGVLQTGRFPKSAGQFSPWPDPDDVARKNILSKVLDSILVFPSGNEGGDDK